MKLLLDILTHIMKTIVVCYWPHVGFGETCYKFSCSKSPWITKKKIIQRNITLRTITPRDNPLLSMYSHINQILDQTSVLCYLSTCYRRSLSTKTMIISSMRTKNKDFRYPLGMHFPQKYDHIRPQGRPHEKEFKLFSNTKINVTKVGTEKED